MAMENESLVTEQHGPSKRPRTISAKVACPECGALGAWDRSPWNMEQHLKRPICIKNRKQGFQSTADIWNNFSFSSNWDKKEMFNANAFSKISLGNSHGMDSAIPLSSSVLTTPFSSGLEQFVPQMPIDFSFINSLSPPLPSPLSPPLPPLSPPVSASPSTPTSDETLIEGFDANDAILLNPEFFTACDDFADVFHEEVNSGIDSEISFKRKREKLESEMARLQEAVRILDEQERVVEMNLSVERTCFY